MLVPSVKKMTQLSLASTETLFTTLDRPCQVGMLSKLRVHSWSRTKVLQEQSMAFQRIEAADHRL